MSSSTGTQNTFEKRTRYKGSLRNTFLVTLLPISIILILLMGAITYLRARTGIQNLVNQQLNANLEAMTEDFDGWLKTRFIRMDLTIRRQIFQDALEEILTGYQLKDDNYLNSREILFGELNAIKRQGEVLLFNHFFIALPNGLIIASSNSDWEMENIQETDFYQILTENPGSMAVHNPIPLIEDDTVIITGIPVISQFDSLKASIFGISGSLSMIGFLESGTKFNPDAQGYIITHSDDFISIDPYQLVLTYQAPSDQQVDQLLPLRSRHIFGETEDQFQILSIASFDGTSMISNYTWLPSLNGALVLELPQDIAFGELNQLGPFTLVVALVLGITVMAVILGVTQRLVGPLRGLTDTAQQFAQGNWEKRAIDTRGDEIGLLSHTFNVMAQDLFELYRSLESQVIERTRSLEQRSQQLEATAQVARESAAIRNLDELLGNTTQLISEFFGFYHVGIFLLDDARKYAVLQAANSEGGKRMLERSHRLEVGQVGVVGHVAGSGSHRIALDVGEDATFFDNPDLPETRSELALPLKIQNKVIGVLDVQSKIPAAFEPSDVEVLQILADQITLAIENARLLGQSQEALQELQHAYGSQTRAGWSKWLKTHQSSYYFDRIRVIPIPSKQIKQNKIFATADPRIQNTNDGSSLVVPITLRDQKIGTIVLRRDSNQTPWNNEDLTIVQESINQISAALDNARLLDETRRYAEHEQTVSKISSKFSQAFDMSSILTTAVRELSQLPNVTGASVHISPPESDKK